ncbi:MAG: cytochrome b [Hyphomicrobiales bacterium]|nr:cytochrome b [Hyphomicrobiales bacterium]
MKDPTRPSPRIDRYDAVARVLHWAAAILIVIGFAMGLLIDAPPKAWYPAWLNTHALIGVSVLLIALVRLAWRVRRPPPGPLPGASALATSAVRIGHGALYAAMILVPLIGFAPLFTRGFGVDFGLFAIPSPLAKAPRETVHLATEIHSYAAYALAALAVGHVAAALWHQFRLRDNAILRMMPPRGS